MSACPSWCTWDTCQGDHWASPGEKDWPDVEATAYVPDGRQYVAAAPTWGEVEGLAPAVMLWFRRLDADNDVAVLDDTFEFTPAEARELAARLIAAAEAADRVREVR